MGCSGGKQDGPNGAVPVSTLGHKKFKQDQPIKIILIGDSSVGKSSLLLRLVGGSFNDSDIPTIDSKLHTTVRNGKSLKMQVWDTAGHERFGTITSSYYRGAHGIVMVYDITNAVTFESIPKWLEEVDRYSQEDVCKLLLGNKCDMEEERKVPQQDGETFAQNNGSIFFETSAKSSANVESSFNNLVDKILETMYE